MPEAVFKIGYDANSIFQNKKDYTRRRKVGGLILHASDDSANVYLDDILAQIRTASKGLGIMSAKMRTLYLIDGKPVEQFTEHDDVKALNQLVVEYKGDPAKLTIPDGVKKKLQIQMGDG